MKESTLHTFINHQEGFTLHILEGNKLLRDLQNIHSFEDSTYLFFKDIVLSSVHFISYLKSGESIGFYIDSEDPYFRFKLELGHAGQFRTLFLPEEIPVIPQFINGKCRISKTFQTKEPYTSVIELDQVSSESLVNSMLERSYQAKAKVLLNEKSPNSILIAKLPATNVDKKVDHFEDLSIKEYEVKYKKEIINLFNFDVMDEKEINQLIKNLGYNYLVSKEISFHCPCNKERFVANLIRLPKAEIDTLYNEQNMIETRCDYCNKIYNITSKDLLN